VKPLSEGPNDPKLTARLANAVRHRGIRR
jgi:hypothetical protein